MNNLNMNYDPSLTDEDTGFGGYVDKNSYDIGDTTPSTTSASIDTSSTFWGDVLEMGDADFGGGVRTGGGSAPSGSAMSPFKASTGNIAQILKMFSPYNK
ncbi:hypothetical protein AB4259_02680 [Vibrio amylolyticus]|uniref:hypothetical protein n=1 Tax=Vibrio amylolyticus TaxID=2847292 RepID=UPI0035526477